MLWALIIRMQDQGLPHYLNSGHTYSKVTHGLATGRLDMVVNRSGTGPVEGKCTAPVGISQTGLNMRSL